MHCMTAMLCAQQRDMLAVLCMPLPQHTCQTPQSMCVQPVMCMLCTQVHVVPCVVSFMVCLRCPGMLCVSGVPIRVEFRQ